MNGNALRSAKGYVKRRQWMKRWHKAVACMAAAVVFVTTCELILPAITLEEDVYCGYEEHRHSEENGCYEQRAVCGLSDAGAHMHTSDCYTQERVLACGLEEQPEHIHTDACVETELVLICWASDETEHEHSDECYQEVQTYICGQEECAGHTHSDVCYETKEALTCELTEEDHIHTDGCYEQILTCEKPEHIHSLICYSDQGADLETAAEWEKTFEAVELTGNRAEDVVALARSQLGYTESAKNYTVIENEDGDEIKKGYSRYGAWYGDPYGDWDAMFVSFCLNYAEIPQEAIPYEASCPNWITELNKLSLYAEADGYIPSAGDIVFFDWDGDGTSDHVGLVEKLEQKEEETVPVLFTIEGNSGNRVAENKYALGDAGILGYGNFAVVYERYAELYGDPSLIQWDYDDDELHVTVTLPVKAGISKAAELQVQKIENESDTYASLLAAANHGGRTVRPLACIDVSLVLDGEEIELNGQTARVTISLKTEAMVDSSEQVSILHAKEEDEIETIKLLEEPKDGGFVFETSGFSPFMMLAANTTGTVTMRPMMETVDIMTDGHLEINDSLYVQSYKDRTVTYTIEDNTLMILIPAYTHFSLLDIELHEHTAGGIVLEKVKGKWPHACTGTIVTIREDELDTNTDTTDIQVIDHEKHWTTETDENGNPYIVVTLPKEYLPTGDWCIVAYYNDDSTETLYDATFFDYNVTNTGGAKGTATRVGTTGQGINSAANYPSGSAATKRLAMGTSDIVGYSYSAQVSNQLTGSGVLNADLNLGTNESSATKGYPIVQGIISSLSGSNCETINWGNNLAEPGFFTSENKAGKSIYNNFQLDFQSWGDTYVLDGVIDTNKGTSVTDGTYHVNNKGKTAWGANFWPLDSVSGAETFKASGSSAAHNWYFGMRWDFEFTVDEDYIGDLLFTFVGDDDLWVFLDGRLILDLGGVHSAYPDCYNVSGNNIIKFPGDYSYVSNSNWPNRVDIWNHIPGTKDSHETQAHTLTVLYMERGGFDSNCYIEFVLPRAIPPVRWSTPPVNWNF